MQQEKYYNAEEVSNLIDSVEVLCSKNKKSKDDYHASLDSFVNNDTYKGDDATASKEYMNVSERDFINSRIEMQEKALVMLKHYSDSFAEKVDAAPNARIDTVTLDMVQVHGQKIYRELDSFCTNFESIMAYLERTYGHITTFTKPRTVEARESLSSLCGGDNLEAGFIYDVKQNFICFDEEESAYVDSFLFDDDVADYKKRLFGADAMLAGVKVFEPNVNAVFIRKNNKKVEKKDKATKNKLNKKVLSEKEKLETVKNRYQFESEEWDYLEKNHKDLLLALYGAGRYSSADADVILSHIKNILNDSGVSYLCASHKLVETYKLTDQQREYIYNLESMVGYEYKYTCDGKDGSVKLDYRRIAAMEVAAAALFEYGKSTEFVAAVLGNTSFEGEAGHLENSKYKTNEPGYLRALEHYFEYKKIVAPDKAELIRDGIYDKNYADKTIYSLDKPEVFLTELEEYRKNAKTNNICGIGMCQWTTKKRMEDLLNLYQKGDYSFSGIVKAEATMIVKELSGEYDNDVDGVDDYCEKEYGNLSGTEQVRADAKYFYKNYEIGATNTDNNRADVACDIYQSMVGN